MNISLTPELEAFVSSEVQSGLYQSASEVIRAGLRLLKDEKTCKPRFAFTSMDELQDKLAEGVVELDSGKGIPGKQVFAELKEMSTTKRRLRQ